MSLAVVLVVATPPGAGLVAAEGRAVEPLVHAPQAAPPRQLVAAPCQLLLGLQQLQLGRQPVLPCPGLVIGHCSSIAAGTNVAIWRSKALAAPVRQPSAMDCDMGSGKMSSSPSPTPPKIARPTDPGEVSGWSRLPDT